MKFEELYKIVRESPEILDGSYSTSLNDVDVNQKYCQELLRAQYKFLEVWDDYNIWFDEDLMFMNFRFTQENDCKIVSSIRLKKQDNSTELIWKSKNSEKGLMSKIYLTYLLPKLGFISSSTSQYELGMRFWINLITNNIGVYKITLLNNNNKEEPISNINQFNELRDTIWSSSSYVLRIYEKE